ncbi:flagellar hook-basal body complex protein FliE [Bacillus sp. V3B]|uniref:flagellar hook-basal body complex protein FliE n=1 Tax=Bacillus sp. V3B TaxID=2804915 RepID=UPI00210EDECB|nr:flagellar hook-basal body complex protein FliE [Bacillus sp. V3B]
MTFLPVNNLLNTQKPVETTATPDEAQQTFSSFLKNSIEKVNQTQIESDKMTEKLALGQDVDLHEVMIASQKASVTMQLTLEVRNKAVEAYQEMMRMQV